MKRNGFLLLFISVLVVIAFLSGCSLFGDNYTDGEKAVLVNKAVMGAGTTSTSKSLSARTIAGCTVSVESGTSADMAGSAFAADVNDNDWVVFVITYSNVSVTVQDNDGNDVTVVLNGEMNFAMYLSDMPDSFTDIFYGTVNGTVGGESYSFNIDLKSVMTLNGTAYSVTVTGTAGGEDINGTYTANVQVPVP